MIWGRLTGRMRRTAGVLGRRSAELRPDDLGDFMLRKEEKILGVRGDDLGFFAEKRREEKILGVRDDDLGFLAEKRREDFELQMKYVDEKLSMICSYISKPEVFSKSGRVQIESRMLGKQETRKHKCSGS
ncbi:hypothetical protein OIU77_028145 [Salix suchowensis]|uniref:Uncharacterized protein n=1 Tax=Salix suchowensis TaxID=1278906 RepID=A0ABQ9BJ44_9ROSI|nr:hypothetical protein OIU77_028145 [Salix suchowensis]